MWGDPHSTLEIQLDRTIHTYPVPAVLVEIRDQSCLFESILSIESLSTLIVLPDLQCDITNTGHQRDKSESVQNFLSDAFVPMFWRDGEQHDACSPWFSLRREQKGHRCIEYIACDQLSLRPHAVELEEHLATVVFIEG